jgi:tRNA-specific 2-thiouridylase
MQKTVVVGLSGGVDSSVSAYLLKKQGYRVLGLFMKNWDDDPHCTHEADYQDVIQIAKKLDIPFYTVNFVEEYKEFVFANFLEELKLGFTPNPDILCNKEIKFHHFYQKALSLGADYIATGHYAKVDDEGRLMKCCDSNKDQTYFLYAVKQSVFKKVLFPLADYTKPQVRDIAKSIGLCTHDKKDSTGICFIGKRDFKTFLSQYLPCQKGNFQTVDGKILKEHDGYWFYTIGQRKGLEIGGEGKAWFVVDKNPLTNAVIVAQGEDNPHLYRSRLTASKLHLIQEDFPLTLPLNCTAKIRYRQEEQPCTITSVDASGRIEVVFETPQRAVTPRQSIVFYHGSYCLGGALIDVS